MKFLVKMSMALAIMSYSSSAIADNQEIIRISTQNIDLLLRVAPNGRLYQTYLGERLLNEDELNHFGWRQQTGSDGSVSPRGWEAYSTSGAEDFFEPALSVVHSDGNPTTYLYYKGCETTQTDSGQLTRIHLKDNQYPLEVTLNYITYPNEDVIKTWSEIRHQENKPITLISYASGMFYFSEPKYYLTEFSSDWAKEANMSTERLNFGKKVIDTKLGSRAAMHTHPFFEIGLENPAQEDHGRVFMGTLGWTGNFRFTFEVDNAGVLRVIPGINPYASAYELKSGVTFSTPEFIFTLSDQGTSKGSHNLHAWARRHQLKDGEGSRLTLLNNWENTGFNFDQNLLTGLMKEASDIGVDLFLLDDGWFGNKHPRKDDRAGLGDWDVTTDKLPGGIKALTDAAKDAGVKFGIWVEPEMINPASELYEKHPEWVIEQPNRDTYYYRNQLVLDLSNPKVQDYVFGVIDNIMKENPDVAYFKWDCNSPITNIYSPHHKDKQGQLYVDHVRGVYNVFDRVKEKYPNIPMMLCSGGGSRCDYEALKYFTEFWCSDNTDPVERAYIQWGFSQFFPAKAMAAHVTSWNRKTSVKFRTDMASMCKLGFDINLKELNPDELEYARNAVSNWKRLSPVIMDGTQHRLVSPYKCNHMAVGYVDNSKKSGIVFAYDLAPRFKEKLERVKIRGLDPETRYSVKEINLMPGIKSQLAQDGATFSGDYLMKVGLDLFSDNHYSSKVIELKAI